MSSSARTQVLDSSIRDVLIDLVRQYRHVPVLRFAQPQGGRWATFSFENQTGTLSTNGAALRLAIEARDDDFASLYDLMDTRNQPLELVLEDGSKVHAELAWMRRLGERAEIDLYHWTLSTETAPTVWIGRIEGRFPGPGNLSITERGDGWSSSKGGAFRFCGRYTWYILPPVGTAARIVVLDANAESLARDALRGDLLALQFTVGGSLGIDHLIGCDAEARTVSAMSIGHLVRDRSRYRPPVAHELGEAEIWLPNFFSLLAAKIASEGHDSLTIPITAYLDAEADHLDGAYLKLQAGIRTFARRLSPSQKPRLLVDDEGGWMRWVSSLDLGNLVAGSSQLELVRANLAAAMFAGASSEVAQSLKARGIEVPADVNDELARSDSPSHEFLMNGAVAHEIDRDVRRVELLQTIVAALVSSYVGYSGPIHGYDVANDGGRVRPSWWPVSTRPNEAAVRYVAERSIQGPKPEPAPPPGVEFAMIIKIAASDPTHFSELKAQTMNSLAPHVLSLDPVDLEFAQGARDSEFMELAIEQARASTSEEGRISPRVGAVVVKQGEIVARAHRGEFDPGDHAEYTALERKLQNVDLSDATVFTTLEPCTARNHPKLACAQRLIQRGVKRVVIGTLDPNPNIKGEGVMRLREAGISVQLTTPSLMTEIELLNAAFNQQHRAK